MTIDSTSFSVNLQAFNVHPKAFVQGDFCLASLAFRMKALDLANAVSCRTISQGPVAASPSSSSVLHNIRVVWPTPTPLQPMKLQPSVNPNSLSLVQTSACVSPEHWMNGRNSRGSDLAKASGKIARRRASNRSMVGSLKLVPKTTRTVAFVASRLPAICIFLPLQNGPPEEEVTTRHKANRQWRVKWSFDYKVS